jgi:hypothetical protein
MRKLIKLTGEGQIKEGATVLLSYEGSENIHIVEEILKHKTGEEILLETKGNLYFITSMAVDGTSWAKNVKYANPV